MFGRTPQMMPSDMISEYILAGLWPDPASITSFIEMAEQYQAAYAARIARLDELELAASTIRQTMVSDDFESMHACMDQVVRDQESVADNAAVIAKWAAMFADECCAAQASLVEAIEPYREKAQEYLNETEQQAALVEMEMGRAEAKRIQAEYVGTIRSWASRAQNAMRTVTPRTLEGASLPSPRPHADGTPSIRATDYKTSGGEDSDSTPHSRFSEDSQNEEANRDSQDSGGEKDRDARPDDQHGRPSTEKHQDSQSTESSPGTRGGESGNGRASTTLSNEHASDSSLQSKGIPTAPLIGSPGLGTSPSGGLPSSGGLPGGGLGGVKSPSVEGVGLGGQSGLSSAGAGLGSPVGGAGSAAAAARAGGGLGSGGGSSVGGDVGGARAGGGGSGLSALPPVSAVPPVVGRAEAAAAASSSAGGFVPPAGSAAPVQHGPAGGGGGSAVAGGMPGGAMMGAPAVPPAASAVGAAPTPSPGLSQGSLGPGGAAAAAGGAGAAAAGVGVMPSAFSGEVPAEVDKYGQLAADAVRQLAPAMSVIPGMLVAAAVLAEPDSTPQIVITTNDGAGFLPPGCFLPPNMIHAFADLDSPDFEARWFGWADPARVLLDYATERARRLDGEVRFLGLASTGRLSAEVKSAFKKAIPLVTAEASAKPVAENNGRNAHRLKVLSPPFYGALMKASEGVREQAMWQATERAIETVAAAPLRSGAVWRCLSSRQMPSDDQWAAFHEAYLNAVSMCGVLRPGLLANPALAPGGYCEKFALVRAMEVLMCWRTAPNVSAADVVYSAHQAGADVNGILS